jgi:hypothetical protein
MFKVIDCPCCEGGTLKIEIPNGYKIIVDGYFRKLPLKKKCKICNRDIRYTVVHENDYERMVAYVQTKD